MVKTRTKINVLCRWKLAHVVIKAACLVSANEFPSVSNSCSCSLVKKIFAPVSATANINVGAVDNLLANALYATRGS